MDSVHRVIALACALVVCVTLVLRLVVLPPGGGADLASASASSSTRLHALDAATSRDDTMQRRRDAHPNFLVLCFPRVGSTLLSSYLRFSDNIQSMQQELVFMNMTASPGFKDAQTHTEAHALRELGIVKDYFAQQQVIRARQPDGERGLIGWNEKVGWMSLVRHANYTHLLHDYLRHNRFKLVFLSRRNVIKEAVSIIRAQQLADRCGVNAWNKQNTPEWRKQCGKALKKQVERIEPWTLYATVTELQKTIDAAFRFARDSKVQLLTVYYEDLYRRTEDTIRTLSDFLGFKWTPTGLAHARGRYLKQTPDDLRSVVVNFDELRAFFVQQQSEYVSMFDTDDAMLWRR
jgi:LPS sulfotransferase NodH